VKPLVLCYHAVSDGWPDELAVGRREFERQLRGLLRRGYRPAGAGDTIAQRGRQLHVTFDDAYRSLSANAVPVLERLGLRATVFACSGYARDGRPLDVPEVAGPRAAHPGEMRTMTWDELREVAARGLEIGSHTISHPHLPELSDRELRLELSDSRAEIEDELGSRCRYLAYPFGDDDPRVHRAAARAGYDAAFSLAAKAYASRGNRFALPRVDLYRRDGALRAALKTSALRPAIAPAAHRLAGAAPRIP
jgi:peptidoglycan/xylan/chitin deacetylase (PgdA/CDA1 family)